MDIQTTKLELIQLMLSTQEEQILLQLKEILEQEAKKGKLDQYNKELDAADARIDSGNFYTQQEVEKMTKKW